MPCRDDFLVIRQDRLDLVTRLLCELCHDLEKSGYAGKFIQQNPELQKWWQEHFLIDRARREREEREAAIRAKRQAALQKLTLEECELLGLTKIKD